MRQPVPLLQRILTASVSLLALSALWAQQPERVEACSYYPTWSGFDGFPSADAEDVPTDVAPIYRNPLEGLPSYGTVTFSLQSADGTEVALETRAVESRVMVKWTELRPASPLQPNTRYTLRARVAYDPKRFTQSSAEESIAFTTGAGPAAALPALGQVQLQHVVHGALPESSTCGASPATSTCLRFPEGVLYQVRQPPVAEGFVETLELVRGPSFVTQLGEHGQRKCVEVSQRAANGSFGPVRSVCHDQGPLYFLDGPGRVAAVVCTTSGITLSGSDIADQLSPVPPDQWDAIRPKRTGPEAGVEDASLSDAGSAQEGDGSAPPSADADDAPSPASSTDMEPDVEEAACSLSQGRSNTTSLALMCMLAAWLLRRRGGQRAR
jgi:hypothetical protein